MSVTEDFDYLVYKKLNELPLFKLKQFEEFVNKKSENMVINGDMFAQEFEYKTLCDISDNLYTVIKIKEQKLILENLLNDFLYN